MDTKNFCATCAQNGPADPDRPAEISQTCIACKHLYADPRVARNKADMYVPAYANPNAHWPRKLDRTGIHVLVYTLVEYDRDSGTAAASAAYRLPDNKTVKTSCCELARGRNIHTDETFVKQSVLLGLIHEVCDALQEAGAQSVTFEIPSTLLTDNVCQIAIASGGKKLQICLRAPAPNMQFDDLQFEAKTAMAMDSTLYTA